MALEIDLFAPIDAAKVLAQYHASFMAYGAEQYQSDSISPVGDVVAGPADYLDAQQRRLADRFPLLILPDFVSVQLLARAAYHTFSLARFDRGLTQPLPSVLPDSLGL